MLPPIDFGINIDIILIWQKLMTCLKRYGGIPKMFVILTYAKFATIFLANPDRKKAAIEFTEHPGRVIHE
jgi:hypothetical protein